MSARNDVKKPFGQSLYARPVLAAAQLRFAARVDFLVARWLERCATNVEAAQRLFKTNRAVMTAGPLTQIRCRPTRGQNAS